MQTHFLSEGIIFKAQYICLVVVISKYITVNQNLHRLPLTLCVKYKSSSIQYRHVNVTTYRHAVLQLLFFFVFVSVKQKHHSVCGCETLIIRFWRMFKKWLFISLSNLVHNACIITHVKMAAAVTFLAYRSSTCIYIHSQTTWFEIPLFQLCAGMVLSGPFALHQWNCVLVTVTLLPPFASFLFLFVWQTGSVILSETHTQQQKEQHAF